METQRCLVQGKHKGVVRYHGRTTQGEGVWLGVELDEPEGDCDGSYGGVAYFSCAPRCGVFVRSEDLVVMQSSSDQRSLAQSSPD